MIYSLTLCVKAPYSTEANRGKKYYFSAATYGPATP